MMASKQFGIVPSAFSASEKKLLKGMVTSYAKPSPIFQLVVPGTIAARKCKSLNYMWDHAMVAAIRLPQSGVLNLTFAAPEEETPHPSHTH